MRKLVIFGNTEMAKLAYFYFAKDSQYEVAAFTVDAKFLKHKTFEGLPMVPFEEVKKLYPSDDYNMFIAIGFKQLNRLRADKYFSARNLGYKLISYVNSKLTSWGDVKIGDNCFILENQVIQPYVNIGNNVFIWSGNHIGHDVSIGDHCWISSHVVLSGGVSVGPYTFIGVNAAIGDHIRVGSRCIIGIGAVINKDTKDDEVYVAEPARRHHLESNVLEKLL